MVPENGGSRRFRHSDSGFEPLAETTQANAKDDEKDEGWRYGQHDAGLGGMQGKMGPGGCPECLPVENFRDFRAARGAKAPHGGCFSASNTHAFGIEYRPFYQGAVRPGFCVANHLNYLAIYRLGK